MFGTRVDNWMLGWNLGYRPWTIGYNNGSEGGSYRNSDYTGASGKSYVDGRTWSGALAFNFVNSEKYRNVWLEFGVLGAATGMKVEFGRKLGAEWETLDWAAGDLKQIYAGTINADNAGTVWKYMRIEKTLPSVLNLQIKITGSSANQKSLDDIRITGEYDYGYDLRKAVPTAEALLDGAVEGKELGMYFSGKTALENALAEAKRILAIANGAYTYDESKAASEALATAITTFEKNKITTTNAPRIDQAPNQPYVFNVEPGKMTVGLSGIAAVGGGSISSVTAVSKNGVCSIKPITGTGATRTLTYEPTSNYGKDIITVTVTQAGGGSGMITQSIEMSFGIEILNSSVPQFPVVDKVPDQYSVSDVSGPKTIAITGLDSRTLGQNITSVVAHSADESIMDDPVISNINYAQGTATLTYTPKKLNANTKNDKVQITLNVINSTGTTGCGFHIYVYNSENPPAMFDAPENTTILAGSGLAKIILPNVRGADENTRFNVEFVSGQKLLAAEPTVQYVPGQHFAFLNIENVGIPGTVSLRVFVGDIMQEIDVTIEKFDYPGISFSIYDAVMWQQVNVVSVGAMIAAEAVYDGGASFPGYATPWLIENLWTPAWDKMTVGHECFTGACHHPDNGGHPEFSPNLATLAMKGFFLPKESGSYQFAFSTNADFTGGLWFDVAGESWKNAACIARANSASNFPTGTQGSGADADKVISTSFTLEAGKGYPIYSVRWFTHQTQFYIWVKGPGFPNWTAIPHDYLSPLYDLSKPAAPAGVKIHTTLAEKVRIEWNATSSDKKIAKTVGYNVYANGKKNNSEIITDQFFLLDGLKATTEYDIVVTAVDELGNESYISNIAKTKTLGNSNTPPGAPGSVRDDGKTGETIKLKWNKPSASGSEAVAYDVYVGTTKNNVDYIYADSFFIRGLKPETTYQISVVAYNGSMIPSEPSQPIGIKTKAFDAEDERGLEFNEHRISLDVEMKNISWTEGVGINAAFKDGSLFANNGENTFQEHITAYKPGIVRWGALDANEYGFQSVTGSGAGNYASSVGKARKDKGLATHAMNLDYCNKIGAYYSFGVGVKEGPGGLGKDESGKDKLEGNWYVDYRDAKRGPQVFKNLIEYLAGPSSSPLGAVRATEGFSQPLLTKDKSKGIIIEFGNEVWGGVHHNAHIGTDYVKYGQWCRDMADTMRTSKYWDDIKDLVYFKYSGRDPVRGTENSNVIRGTARPDQVQVLGVSGYLGGNLDYNPEVEYGETIGQYYRLRIEHVATNLKGMQGLMKEQLTMTNGGVLNFYFYETQVSSSSYFGNLGQAVVLLDYLTASMKYGSMVPAIFTYGGGEWLINIGDKLLSHYHMARLINTYCKGHLVSSSVRTNNQLYVDKKVGDLKPLLDHDPVGTSVFNDGKKWSIALFSRDFDNQYSVEINLPEGIGEIKNAKRIIVKGKNPEIDGPSTREDYEILGENETITLKSGDIAYVPPFSMVLYTFEAADPKFEKLPLGHFDRVQPSTLKLAGNTYIDKDKGSTQITAIVTPEEAFSTDVIWQLDFNNNKHLEQGVHTLPSMSPGADYATLRTSSGKVCNGTLWLKATLADNPAIAKSVPIRITNQTTADCEFPRDAVEDAENEKLLIYPNPAEDMLYIKTQSSDLATVTVYNSIGVRVMSETASSELIELNVAALTAGQYVVTVSENGTTKSIPFTKK